ncbi:hypothetical protein J2W56_004724 [Nocardia kruczakiae]|uniref:Uncharacterized protein n=1 Tax=Nocardia kruczakiae TaxID=261477 RepID=A0ABU1XK85_9NOCA|nr:hypothetical protein [Nocardia kruczakiae]
MRHNASTLAEYESPGEQGPHPVPDGLPQNTAHHLPGGGRSLLSSGVCGSASALCAVHRGDDRAQ